FLDEIGDLGLPLQAKLLRALETGEVEPVAGPAVRVDLRIVSATNVDVASRLETGQFRPDLYYRLCADVLRIPPLRERRGDLPAPGPDGREPDRGCEAARHRPQRPRPQDGAPRSRRLRAGPRALKAPVSLLLPPSTARRSGRARRGRPPRCAAPAGPGALRGGGGGRRGSKKEGRDRGTRAPSPATPC